MKTELLYKNPQRAAEIILTGGLVGVPTETVYGLAGNGLDADAVDAIYEVKDRPAVKALSLMVPGPEAMDLYCEDVPEAARLLADKFWPGPLTIILKSKELVPEIVRAGGSTVGLRCPLHEDTLALLKAAGVPLAAPSANPSGSPSPKRAEEVMAYFDGKIGAVIDGGVCSLGLESTILDMSHTPYRILRQGALAEEKIRGSLADTVTCLGITGGTGCGKTTALKVLQELGFLLVDTDEVYHELLEQSLPLQQELQSRFPTAFTGGQLDRKALGTIVFHNEDALRDLNRITHRHIHAEVNRRLADYAMQGGRYAAIDAIALFESGIDQRCRLNVAVTAKDEVRVQRIMARDHISEEYARSRVKAQRSNEAFAELCGMTLTNNGTQEEFAALCRERFEEVVKEWTN